MNTLQLAGTRSVLCLGAHADDIEIGAGGMLLGSLPRNEDVEIRWVVFSATGSRAEEARKGARRIARDCLNEPRVELFEFRDGYFPADMAAIKDKFEELKTRCDPDLILTHHGDDLHQDHRIISELTWNTFRDHLILEYEIPKYDGGLRSPNVFVELSPDVAAEKTKVLMEVFESQREKRWFSPSNFEALLRLRGLESNAESGFAEAFYSRKMKLGWRSPAERSV